MNANTEVPLLPACPITGRPAKRHIHGFARGLMIKLWKYAGAGDISRLFPVGKHFSLYESDCGLYFFEPRVAGDDEFYRRFYEAHKFYDVLQLREDERADYRYAAAHVAPNARVLDVGCGGAGFASHVPHSRYRGLDPYASETPENAVVDIVRETVPVHWEHARGQYDVVTAFQVVEHVAAPREFTQQLVDLLCPGGTLIVGVPLQPSEYTEIPNFLINAPPHHLTWWSKSAVAALAETLGLEIVSVAELSPSPHEEMVYWMHKFSFTRSQPPPNEVYIGHRWLWHLNLSVSFGLAHLACRWLPAPKPTRPTSVILVARKPQLP